MTNVGIGPRDVLALARHARSSGSAKGAILVTGVLAEHLAGELRAGADPGAATSLVRTQGDPAHAAALVRVVAGAATTSDLEALRSATRALVPVVAVQTGAASVELPYVLATDVVDCEPGRGFPVAEIAQALARVLGRDAAPLAGSLPVLRGAVQERRTADGALSAGALAITKAESHLPLLALAQARMLSDVSAAEGRPAPATPRAMAEAVGAPLATALASGLVARALVRRLPVRGRLVQGAVAAATTYALAQAFRRVERTLRAR